MLVKKEFTIHLRINYDQLLMDFKIVAKESLDVAGNVFYLNIRISKNMVIFVFIYPIHYNIIESPHSFPVNLVACLLHRDYLEWRFSSPSL